MPTTNVPNQNIGGSQANHVEPAEIDLETVLRFISQIDGVEAEARPKADCCGVTGCRQDEGLVQVRLEGHHPRVLCPVHLTVFVGQEGRMV